MATTTETLKLLPPIEKYIESNIYDVDNSADDVNRRSRILQAETSLPHIDMCYPYVNPTEEEDDNGKNQRYHLLEPKMNNNMSENVCDCDAEMAQSHNLLKMAILYTVTIVLCIAGFFFVIMDADILQQPQTNKICSVSPARLGSPSVELVSMECEACVTQPSSFSSMSASSSVTASSLESIALDANKTSSEQTLNKDEENEDIGSLSLLRDVSSERKHSETEDIHFMRLQNSIQKLMTSSLERQIQNQNSTIMDFESEVETLNYKMMAMQHDHQQEKDRLNAAYQELKLETARLVEWMKYQIFMSIA